MTAATRSTRAHPWPSTVHRPLALVAPERAATDPSVIEAEPPVVTVQITVRGHDAVNVIAPLVAAVHALGRADVSVEGPHTTLGRRWHEDDRSSEPTVPTLVILTDEFVAVLDGERLTLPRREYDLLLFLARHPRRVFTRGQLLQSVWGYEFDGGGRTVDVHVRRLRQKLGGRGPTIATVRGVGYRLDDADLVTVT